jgi:DNA end-binding protein Ku
MRNKEYLVTVRPDGPDSVLILQTMYFSDEVRSPAEELPNLPGEEQFSDRELAIARQLIDAMTAPWDAEQYQDTHRQRVQELVASKHEGHEIVLEAPAPAPKVVDLMAALEASVKAAGAGSALKAAARTQKKTEGATATRRTKPPPEEAAAKPAEAPRRSSRKKAS